MTIEPGGQASMKVGPGAQAPLKIGLVMTASAGGIGRHVASIAPRFAARGHRVRIFCPASTRAAHDLDGLGVDVLPLAALARSRGADVLHAHGLKAGALSVPVTRATRTPLAVTWHNAVLGSGPSAGAARALQRFVARGADLTLGASSDLVELARRLGARDARLAPVAAPALPAADIPRAAERQRLGLAESDTMVLTVSRLAPQKNLGMLADVAAALADRPGLRFFVVGEGPERDPLQARIDAEHLPVRLLGHRDDVSSLYAAADLALLTSTWEARALVAQEALLAGLPLVSTDVGGIRELVGRAAVLVGLGDVPAAAATVRSLAADSAARAALAAAGRRQAATWPDEDAVADQLLALYRGLSQR